MRESATLDAAVWHAVEYASRRCRDDLGRRTLLETVMRIVRPTLRPWQVCGSRAPSSTPRRVEMVQIQGVFAELDKTPFVRKLKRGREGKCR